jgi:LPXTG-site transpeptidase (sortase) family protein
MTSTRRRRSWWVGAGIAVVLVAGGGIAMAAASGSAPSTVVTAPPSADPRGAVGHLQDPAIAAPQAARTDATASRVEIPAIGVDSTLEQLALEAGTDVLTPPTAWLSAGWYRDGTVPGDVGPAVIAGHVDSVTKPAVFARLGELRPGDQIRVTLSTGAVEIFAVDSIESAPKNAFPTELVYGPTPTAQLRLITCDGVFDSATGHYLDNLIVFASLTS